MITAEKITGKDGKLWIRATCSNPLVEVVTALNSVPGAMHSVPQKAWAIPVENRAQFEDIMGDYLINWLDEENKSNGGISEDSIPSQPIAPGYSVTYGENDEVLDATGYKTKPWGMYQVKGFNLMVDRNFLILADDAGLGKTWQVANAIEAKKKMGLLERGIVVIKASLVYNWRDEIEMHTHQKAVVITGSPKERMKLYSQLHNRNDWTFLVVSYEMFRMDICNLQLLDNFKPLQFCVVDEAHKIKNPNSKLGGECTPFSRHIIKKMCQTKWRCIFHAKKRTEV